MRLEFSKHAEHKLDGIYNYLSQESEMVAGKIYTAILNEIDRLLSFPQMASVESLLQGELETFRSLVVRKRYKVIYFIENETIYIVDIWDCRQDPDVLIKSIKKDK